MPLKITYKPGSEYKKKPKPKGKSKLRQQIEHMCDERGWTFTKCGGGWAIQRPDSEKFPFIGVATLDHAEKVVSAFYTLSESKAIKFLNGHPWAKFG